MTGLRGGFKGLVGGGSGGKESWVSKALSYALILAALALLLYRLSR